MVLSTLLNVVLLAAESGTKLVNVEDLLDKLLNWSIDAGKSILAALIIFIIGRFVIKQINRLFRKILERRKLEVSVRTFLESLVSLLLNIVLAFAVISKFAGGLIILVFKPFKVGDYIDGPDDESGTVKEIQIFHTVLTTVDNRIIYVPNGLLSSNAITNYSKQETRRAEWVFGVEYGEDFERVKEVLQRIIDNDPRILKTPAPMIALGALSASSVDIKVRAWAKTADYWDVYFDMNKTVYETFNKEGIGFPFPQLTVHQAKD